MEHKSVSDCDESDGNSIPRLLDRRSYLNLGTAAVAAAFGATIVSGDDDPSNCRTGCSVDSAAVTRHGISFDRELDAVDDLGLDPTGSKPIDGAVPTTDDTLVSFPPGTYLVENTIDPNSVSNWGIRGTGDHHEDVRFVVPEREAMDVFTPDGENVLIENVTFDQGPENHTSIGNQIVVSDGLQFHDVEYAGFNPNHHTGGTHSLAVRVTDPDGVGVIEGFKHVGPSHFAEDPLDNPIPIWTGGGAKGTLYIRDAHIENGGCHSIYGSKTEGPVRVEGGIFKNCQNTHMRLCGSGSWLRDATVIIDTEHAHRDNLGEYTASTGVWWESGPYQQTGGLIEDCDIICKTSAPNSGLLKIDQTAGSATVRNTHVHNEVDDVPSIVAQRPGDSPFGWPAPERPWDVTFEGVTTTGSGGSGAALDIVARDGSVVRDCSIDGGGEDGIRLVDSQDCIVEDSNVSVPGQATVFESASASTSGISTVRSGLRPGRKLLEVEAPSDDIVSYRAEIDGDVEGIGLNQEDSVEGTTATGAVAGGIDRYGFTGMLTDFQADDDVVVRVDGQKIDPSIPRGRLLEITTDRPDTVVSYEFAVDGKLEGVDLNDEDAIIGQKASGAVAGATDTYRFSGSFDGFEADGELTVHVDGREVDPEALGAAALPNTLVIDASTSNPETLYAFEVSGDLAKDPGRSVERYDDVTGGRATGRVTTDGDAYRFSGNLLSLDVDGDASVAFEATANE